MPSREFFPKRHTRRSIDWLNTVWNKEEERERKNIENNKPIKGKYRQTDR